MKEYIVIAHSEADIDSVHDDLIVNTSFNTAVNQSTVPTRAVGVANAREGMPVMTHYYLTDSEAVKLAKDPRVAAVHVPPTYTSRTPHAIPKALVPLNAIQRPVAYNNVIGNFNRNGILDSYNVNWGLRRTSLPAPESVIGNTYNYDRAGAGVDIVIMDDGVQPNHPEFMDSTGVSRVQTIDWFKASGVPGKMPIHHYNTDCSLGGGEHGTHVAGIAAGKTYGYAKSARIYSLRVFGDASERVPDDLHFDLLLGWHQRKPVDPNTGVKRPTVLNMSWGYAWYYSNESFAPDVATIASTNYRGSVRNYNTPQRRNINYGQVYEMHGFRVTSEDVACQMCENAGIIVIRSAGNSRHKIDVPNGADYNNFYTIGATWAGYIPAGNPIYYHRGPSPMSANAIVVSSVKDTTVINNSTLMEQIDYYSERGPGCAVAAPGTNITSSTSRTTTFPIMLYRYGTQANSTVEHSTKISGTSMAGPQATGVIALYMANNPTAKAAAVKTWISSMGIKNQISTTTTNNDWANQYALQGGPNNYLYNPYHNGYTGP